MTEQKKAPPFARRALCGLRRQSKDDVLWKMARRIQGRAERRISELLEEDKSKGGSRFHSTNVGAQSSTIKAAANGAGLSEHQLQQARAIP